MTSSALHRFLEHAVDTHAARLDDAFPTCFQWQRLCQDAPAMAEAASGGALDASDMELAETIRAQTDVAFRVTHVTALAVLCAAEPHIQDPEATLDTFGEPPGDEEEERFAVLAAEVLGPAEEFLHEPATPLDERGIEAQRLYGVAWPLASEFLALSGLFGDVDDQEVEPAHEAVHPILAGTGRIAVLLAAMRWMARYPDAS